jgi:hypothetical protein
MTINKSARRSHLMTSASTRRILLEGFDSPLNEFKHAAKDRSKISFLVETRRLAEHLARRVHSSANPHC